MRFPVLILFPRHVLVSSCGARPHAQRTPTPASGARCGNAGDGEVGESPLAAAGEADACAGRSFRMDGEAGRPRAALWRCLATIPALPASC